MTDTPFEAAVTGIEASFDRLLASHRRLRKSHAELLAAAKTAASVIRGAGLSSDIIADLQAAIAHAEELAPL